MKTILRIFIAPLLLILAASACVSFAEMEEELEEFKGQHINVAVAKLGVPDGERVIVGRKIYVWARQETRTNTSPQTSSTHGLFGGHHTTTTYSTQKYQESCKIELVVDDSDIVVSYSVDGDLQTCQIYANRLEGKKKRKR